MRSTAVDTTSQAPQAEAILGCLSDIVLVLAPDGSIRWSNEAVRRYGLRPEALAGRDVAESFHSRDRERFHAGLIRALASPGTPITIESLLLTPPDGPQAHSHDTLTFFPDRPGVTGLLAVIRETPVPERKAGTPEEDPTQQASGESEERLRQAVRLSHIGIFDHDHRSGEVYWSPEQRKIFGWGPDEPVPTAAPHNDLATMRRLIHPDDRDRIAAASLRAHSGEDDGLFDAEYRILRRDGSVRWLVTRSCTFFEGEGPARRSVRTVGANQDITSRKVSQRQFELMRASLEKCNTAIYWINATGEVTYANASACRSLGIDCQDLIGLHVWDFDPDFPQEGWSSTWRKIRTEKLTTLHSRHRRGDGSVFPIEAVASFLEFEGEELTFVFVQDITDRQHAERELQLMKAAIDGSHTSFFSISPSGRIVYANEHACLALGYTRDELIGKKTWEIDPHLTSDSPPVVWQHVKDAGVLRRESLHRRKDGTVYPVEVTSNYFSFRGEEFSLAFAQDISGRKKAERDLRQSEERLRQVTKVYDIGVFERDLLTNATYWSPELREYWRLEPDESIRLSLFTDSIHPEDRRQFDEVVARSRDPRSDGQYRVQVRIILPDDGSIRWLDTRAQTFFEGEGVARRAVRVVGASVDITERVRLDLSLRASERRLREAQSIAHIGDWELNLTTYQLSWSAETFRIFDLEPNAATSFDTFLRCTHPDDRERVRSAYFDSIRNGTPYRITHRIVLRNGEVRYVEERGETDFAQDGTPLLSRGTTQDVTAEVLAEAALKESLAEKETLLREVHHRVKNNLQIISSLLHFQAKKVKDPEHLAAFDDGRNRLRAMILVHEKLYRSTDLSRVDFGSYLRALVQDLRLSSASGANVDVRVRTDELALPIEHALPCGMILSELLTNVFKYAFPDRRPGIAEVDLSIVDGKVRLSVRDDGVGLPADFDPLQASTFGWQLIRNLTAQLGGLVSVERSGGTHVTVTFVPPWEQS